MFPIQVYNYMYIYEYGTSSFHLIVLAGYNRIHGIEVVGEVELVVTKEGMNFQWMDHGFKLHVPENALPEGVSEYSINIKASLALSYSEQSLVYKTM